MNKERITYLCHRYLDNSASEQELHELEAILADPNQDEVLKEVLDNSYYTIIKHQTDAADDVAKQRSFEYITAQPQNKKLVMLWPRFIAVASILLIFIGYYFVSKKQSFTQIAKNQIHDIAPGRNQAILTLANGSKIILTGTKNGQLASQNGTVVNKTADGHIVYKPEEGASAAMVYNTMSTPRGGQYHLTLADGTNVWLDAASSITYPVEFKGNDREVTVTGQAYFEVVHNAAKPFRVKAGSQVIEDIGTHFNINAYNDEPGLKTTLLEGSVKVSRGDISTILTPGEQAVTSASESKIKVKNVDTEGVIAWKEGHFHFDSDNIQTVMRELSRWYNVDVEYEGEIPTREFSGNINRNSKASVVLQILSLSKVHFKIEGKKIIVMPN